MKNLLCSANDYADAFFFLLLCFCLSCPATKHLIENNKSQLKTNKQIAAALVRARHKGKTGYDKQIIVHRDTMRERDIIFGFGFCSQHRQREGKDKKKMKRRKGSSILIRTFII